MLSISNNIVNQFSIKKSKFITYLFRVDSVDDVSKYLSNLNSTYNDATHICYAYIIDNCRRFSDDGEPSGTAGMPILNVLENNNLDHVLCCVVRYFGGIKLGASGLLRAYSNSVSNAIDCSSIINLVNGKLCSISFKYDDTRIIDNILRNSIIVDKVYDSVVSYKFKISKSELDDKYDELCKYNLNIFSNCFIEEVIQK